MNYFPILATAAGIAIAIQAAMNAQLGVLLKSSMSATTTAFFFSCIFSCFAIAASALLFSSKQLPQLADMKSVPVYLWFSGGVLSAFAVGLFYYLIPKMGVANMMSYALTGQILISVTASHFGWFQLPEVPINILKLGGAVFMIGGVLILNWEPSYAQS